MGWSAISWIKVLKLFNAFHHVLFDIKLILKWNKKVFNAYGRKRREREQNGERWGKIKEYSEKLEMKIKDQKRKEKGEDV